MAADGTLLTVLAVVFLATMVRSTFGFGEALVSVPLLAFVIPVEVAVPVAVLLSITVAGAILLQDWREVHVRGAGRLVLATLPGTPIGLAVLRFLPEPSVKTLLGVVIIVFSAYSLMSKAPPRLENDRHAWAFGFLAGIMGGAYGLNGPPLAIYGALRRWSAGEFRATLQGYFLPASLVGMIGYWFSGLWTPDVTRYYLLSLPLALLAILIGRAVNRRIESKAFVRYVHIGLLIVGALLFVQALSSPLG